MAPSAQSVTPDETIPPAPLQPSIINNDNALSQSLQQLSIGTASSTSLPSSPQCSSPSRLGGRTSSNSSPNGKAPSRSPLRRSSPSTSFDAPASAPTLLRKASMNSLHGVGGVIPSRSSPSRRSSSAQFLNAAAMASKSTLPEVEDTNPPSPQHTAASVASMHFKTELEQHAREEECPSTDTLVVLHDSCYGHRYSRPRTSKTSLSTIVERPERIHASILGISVAYVRLGNRHVDGQYPLHPSRDASAIPTIPFRIHKTVRRLALSSQAVTNVHGVKWMDELKIMCDNAEAKLAMSGKELGRPDISRSPEQKVPAKLHEGDLYLCSESLNAMEGALGAVCEGVDAVFQGSASGKGPHRSFVAIRPPGHHCSAGYPSGFCWVNNVHVGISHAALTHGLTHAAIIDFDLHHGDGSQTITWDHNRRANSLAKNALPWKKTSIGYFSLHDINSYPCEMGDEEKVKNASLCIENAHGQSIWNVHLQPWKSESEFWNLYETKYLVLLEKTRNYLHTQTERLRMSPNGPKPKSAIFLSAGFDASEWESSGMQRHSVNVPTEFYARLTRDVVKLAAEEGTAVEGRVISVLEGGYSDRALCTGVFSHISGMATESPLPIKKEPSRVGLGYEIGQKIGAFNDNRGSESEVPTTKPQTYDPTWWSLSQLEQLDATVNPPPSHPEPKKPKDTPPPTYSTPTQSFIAKVTSPNSKRSVSSHGSTKTTVPRGPSPPPPEVDWTVAAHELSKLLIPTDRQTMSCKPEELSAEASRVRKERQSILTPPASSNEQVEISNPRMALRARKPTKAVTEKVEGDEGKKPAAKANRRKTVAGAAVLGTEKTSTRSSTPNPEPSYSQPTTQSSRRLSLASNTGSVTSETSLVNGHRVLSSGPGTTTTRPDNLYNAGPSSSISSRAEPFQPVPAKKSRAPTRPLAEPSKAPRVRRKSPLNEAGLPVRSTGGPSERVPIPSGAALSSTVPSGSQDSSIDTLTSGMKKIKLNLTTKAQREAKEQAKQEVNTITANAESKAPVTKLARPRTAESAPINREPAPIPPSMHILETERAPSGFPQRRGPEPQSQAESAPPIISTPLGTEEAFQLAKVPIPANASASPSPAPARAPAIIHSIGTPQQVAPTDLATANSDVFIPYQPEGPPPETMAQQEPVRWLPPNTTVTPASMKRNELPVFTSTSPIPFGSNANFAETSGLGQLKENREKRLSAEVKRGEDIWEVPQTPAK